jgi:hypothetical protein
MSPVVSFVHSRRRRQRSPTAAPAVVIRQRFQKQRQLFDGNALEQQRQSNSSIDRCTSNLLVSCSSSLYRLLEYNTRLPRQRPEVDLYWFLHYYDCVDFYVYYYAPFYFSLRIQELNSIFVVLFLPQWRPRSCLLALQWLQQ